MLNNVSWKLSTWNLTVCLYRNIFNLKLTRYRLFSSTISGTFIPHNTMITLALFDRRTPSNDNPALLEIPTAIVCIKVDNIAWITMSEILLKMLIFISKKDSWTGKYARLMDVKWCSGTVDIHFLLSRLQYSWHICELTLRAERSLRSS